MSHWPMMTDDEQTRLINEFSYPSVSDSHQPLEKTLCQLFCEQANACPEAIAIEHNGQIISYAQLWKNSIQAASTITRRLLAANRGDEKLCIAIMAYRSIKVVQTMWSVLLAGHYYINIDPDLPFERKAWILRETHAFMLVTDLVDTIDEDRFKYAIPIITHTSLLNTDVAYDIDSVQNAEAKVLMAPNDLAYIIFTSGSTGIPKGVCATHKNIICRTVGVGCHSIKPGYRVGQVCSLSFDVSTFEIFATLLNGGTLVIVDCTAIASCSALEELHLDMLNPPTAVFNILSKQAESSTFFPTLNSVIFAGEKANLKCVQAVSLHPPLTLMNGYGPTETTHNALCYTVTSDVSQKYFIPIGRPLPNTQVYVVDNYLQLVPIGVPGELLIGGAGFYSFFDSNEYFALNENDIRFIENKMKDIVKNETIFQDQVLPIPSIATNFTPSSSRNQPKASTFDQFLIACGQPEVVIEPKLSNNKLSINEELKLYKKNHDRLLQQSILDCNIIT
ncbi:unnamed protein product [Rotaria socialis]